MVTEATFEAPVDAFPLGCVLQRDPSAIVELERVVPTGDATVPHVWIRGADVDEVGRLVAERPGVAAVELIDAVEDSLLLGVDWRPDAVPLLDVLSDCGCQLLRFAGTGDHWTFEVRAVDRDDVAAVQRRCREQDVPITVTKLRALRPAEAGTRAAVTDKQLEALVYAFENGYFETPRQVTMAEIGDELGISEQAVGSRLRRGIRAILGRALTS